MKSKKLVNNKIKVRENKNNSYFILIILFILALINLISLISLISATSYTFKNPLYSYNIELNYDKGNIEIKNVNIEFFETIINVTQREAQSNIYLEIIDNNKNLIQKVYFKVPNFAAYDIANESGDLVEGGIETFDNVSFNVFAPYYENGYQIVVYNNTKELDREFISQFSKTGFNIEDFRDKEAKEEKETKEIIDTIKKEPETNYKNLILVLLIILIILIIVLIYFLRRKK